MDLESHRKRDAAGASDFAPGEMREEVSGERGIEAGIKKTPAAPSYQDNPEALRNNEKHRTDNLEIDGNEMADVAVENASADDVDEKSGISRVFSRLKRIVSQNLFSSLTRRIATLNLLALVVLLSGILYLNQFREGLIDARVESLMIQGRIIAGAVAASASVETNAVTVDPEKLIELQAGESTNPARSSTGGLEFPFDMGKVAPLVQSLIKPTRTRARIYDSDGSLLLDSRHLYAGGQVLRYQLPPVNGEEPGMIDRIGKTLNRWLQRNDLPVYRELTGTGEQYPEVLEALVGGPATVVRMSERGELIVSVAVPVQRFRAVHGVLLLSTQGGDIDRIVAEERIAIMRVFLVAFIVTLILSILLASTIANPLRKLAQAAKKVRKGSNSRVDIPDFSNRSDEVGKLSSAISAMTNSLYSRIEAIEKFAADVSHELKNPLTSLRSAVETLPLAKTAESRSRLLQVIQHDVLRLDRLITDISDASRLDADLVREDAQPVDIITLLENVVLISREIKRDGRELEITLDTNALKKRRRKPSINGHESRLGQVFTNLIDNARSFVPAQGGLIAVKAGIKGNLLLIEIADNGPGILAEDPERIFERFYTDRSDSDGFGQNSGLGLSISKQIVEAHGGEIRVRNLPKAGACFTVCLPLD